MKPHGHPMSVGLQWPLSGRWEEHGSSDEFDARHLLDGLSHPSTAIVVDFAYEEYCRRIERGESIDTIQFLTRFPEAMHELKLQIECGRLVDDQIAAFLNGVAAPWPEPGTEFCGFRLIQEIGRGATSRVFEAEDVQLGNRPVVVKVSRRIGRREARFLGKLSHKHIVPVLSAQQTEDYDVICMPHLSITTLQHVIAYVNSQGNPLLRRRGAVIEQAVRAHNASAQLAFNDSRSMRFADKRRYLDAVIDLAWQVADGLSFAHRHGIIHGDVKPSNILVAEERTALLFDFNLSLTAGEQSRCLGGTLNYMSPEQLRVMIGDDDDGTIGVETDIFSFGATFYEMLTGRLPFGCRDRSEPGVDAARRFLQRQENGVSVALMRERIACASVIRFIDKCLQFNPEDRISTAEELEHELAKLLRPARRVIRTVRANPRHSLATVIGVVLLVIAAAIWWLSRPSAEVRLIQNGLAAYKERNIVLATQCFRDVHELLPTDVSVQYLLAVCNLQSGRYAEALPTLKQAVNESENGSVRALLAYAHLMLTDEVDGAGVHFAMAARHCDVTAELLNDWAYCEMKRGRIQHAQELLDQSLSMKPDLPCALFNRCILELRSALRGRRPPEMQFVERLDVLRPGCVDVHLIAAKLHWVDAAFGSSDMNVAQERLESAADLGASDQELSDAVNAFRGLRIPATPRPRKPRNSTLDRIVFPFPDWRTPVLPSADSHIVRRASTRYH